MKRLEPPQELRGMPCCIVAVACALGKIPKIEPNLKEDGYTTLEEANKYIRKNLSVRKRIDYKRGNRPKLKEINMDGKAIVCVLGHYLFVDGDVYYSFFNNNNDNIISIWLLNEPNGEIQKTVIQ